MKTPGLFEKAISTVLLLSVAGELRSAVTDLSNNPLVTAATATVKPNLLFVLDDSGSMGWDYMPDWAKTDTEYLYQNSGWNTIAYNPAITYVPPVKYKADGTLDTTTYPSQTAANTNNWTTVKSDGYGVQTSLLCPGGTATGVGCDLTLFPNQGPAYYVFKPGEYCKDRDLTVCNVQSAPDTTYSYPAPLRWCKTSTDAEAAAATDYQCRAARIESGGTSANTFDQARYPKPPLIELDFSNNKSATLTQISLDGIPILSLSTSLATNNANTMAGMVMDAVNANSMFTGMVAEKSGSIVKISQVDAAVLATLGPITSSTAVSVAMTGLMTVTEKITISQVPGEVLRTVITPTNNSYPYPGGTEKAQTRLDCLGLTCTFAEEMTNYANWLVYYRTRMQMMKTATSRAFAPISSDVRTGYLSINNSTGTDFLNIRDYTIANKNAWYDKLFAAKPNSSTPLRTALTTAGRMFGGKLNGSTLNGSAVVDPLQYSCQQNFTLLSTDGYWNGPDSSVVQLDGSTAVGNQDGPPEVRPMLDGRSDSDTLSDVAEYYWKTDLRPVGAGSVCTGTPVPPAAIGNPLCPASGLDELNNVPIGSLDTARWQHMTTFTLGLGASGYLLFDPSYETAARGDFYSVKKGITADPNQGVCVWQNSGACNWPLTQSNEQPNIDDLWHASATGRGIYFNASDPEQLVSGLSDTLDNIARRLGASAAAITSNANISAADNLIFSTTFTTGEWSSQVIRQRFTDIFTGTVPDYDPTKPAGTYNTPDYNYDWTARDPLDAKAFTARQIWTSDGFGGEIQFEWNALKGAGLNSYFEASHISAVAVPPALEPLSQFCTGDVVCLPLAKQEDNTDPAKTATGQALVDFLRGDRSNEGALTDTNKYYRQRRHVLGDVVNAETVYLQKPLFSYVDPGYADHPTDSFAALKQNRPGRLYVPANDGMVHAFNAGNANNTDPQGGQEVWSYVPRLVLPEIYKLADKKYQNDHRFLVDGTPVSGDICPKQSTPFTCSGSEWKTILVGGLGHGGRGFYALDITDPSAKPVPLWEFGITGKDADHQDDNIGYSYGNPVITKLKDGHWVVLVTSGYNNVPNAGGLTGDGKGYLYILDAWTGKLIRKISTGVGDVTTPSGLARITTWVDLGSENNIALRVYGGDLLGNLWRFDINGDIDPAGYEAQRLTTFRDASDLPQPITAKPELTDVDGAAVVYVGTGRFLGLSDLNDKSPQSFYAIKDPLDPSKLPYASPRTKKCSGASLGDCFVQQTQTAGTCPVGTSTLICSGNEIVWNSSDKPVDFGVGYGWFIDLPESGERANSDPVLVFGTLVFNTNVPEDIACTGGGHTNQYFVNYRTGGAVWAGVTTINATTLGPALGSRPVMVGLPNNRLISVTQGSSGKKMIKSRPILPPLGGAKRSSWRELITE